MEPIHISDETPTVYCGPIDALHLAPSEPGSSASNPSGIGQPLTRSERRVLILWNCFFWGAAIVASACLMGPVLVR